MQQGVINVDRIRMLTAQPYTHDTSYPWLYPKPWDDAKALVRFRVITQSLNTIQSGGLNLSKRFCITKNNFLV
jgi:hypothetical protein